jgi:hypothetical protein
VRCYRSILREYRDRTLTIELKSTRATSTPETSHARLVWNLNSRETAILAGILIATIVIYLPSLRNGWVSDDWDEFVNDKLIHSWSFVWNSFRYDSWWFRNPAQLPQSAYYRPLENTWFALNALLFGTHPAPWHLVKIVLHAVAVLLCFRLAQLLTGDVAVGLLTAAIFGVMPAHTGAVVWASAIPEPLSTTLEMGALCCFINRKPGNGSSRGLLFALMLYAGATLSHETAILFPLIIVGYVFLFEDSATASSAGRLTSAIRACAPFVVVAIAYMCARANALGVGALFGLHHATTSMTLRGVVKLRPHYSTAQILMTLPMVLLDYLAVLALPAMAGPAHAIEWITHPEPAAFIAAATLIVLAAVAFSLAWRTSHRRVYLFAAVWVFVTMAPALNLNTLLFLIDDRYLYAPSFGWSLAFAVAILQIAAASSRASTAVGAAVAVLLALYAVSTIQLEHYWRDDMTFLQRCVEIAPDVPEYRVWLAAAMNKAGDFDGAAQELERGTTFDPDDEYLHLKLARQYQMMGRQMDFEREFQKYTELSGATMKRHNAAENSDASQPVDKTKAMPSP